MGYKDKDRQKEAQRDWVRQKRAEAKGSTVIIDACGKEHPIDFEGRRRDYEMLKSWTKAEGTREQRTLGILARQYSIINGYLDKSGSLTVQGRRYLGQVIERAA